MSEFIDKIYDTYAEFSDCIVRYKVYLDDEENVVHQKIDDFSDAILNVAWGTDIWSGVSEISSPGKLHFTCAAGQAAYIYYLGRLRNTYNILAKFNIISASTSTELQLISTGNVWTESSSTQIRFVYLATDFTTKYYWNGSAWTTTPAFVATVSDGYIRIKKTSTQFIFTVYDSGYSVLAQATLTGSLVNNFSYQDTFQSGGSSVSSSTFEYTLDYIVGVINDKNLLSYRPDEYPEYMNGRLTNIINLQSKPNSLGKYIDVIDTDELFDESNPEYYQTNVHKLRETTDKQYLSQGFKLSSNSMIKDVQLYAYKTGTIAALSKIWVEIWGDDGSGKPLSLIGNYISNKLEADSITGIYSLIAFTFDKKITLQNNTQYHIVLKGDYTISASNYIRIYYCNVGTYYDRGIPRDFNGSVWGNVVIPTTSRMIFCITFEKTKLVTRRIAYSNSPAYITLKTKSDWEGYGQVAVHVDTATKPGSVFVESGYTSGSITNQIDLGVIPDNYLTFSAIVEKHIGDGFSIGAIFEVAYSDDNIVWSGFDNVIHGQTAFPNCTADLTYHGKHRYWKIRANLYNSAELISWTLDYFTPFEELTNRTKLKPYQYAKVEINMSSVDFSQSGKLSLFELKYREAYELYIKSVKYKVNSSGITADMQLSSE